MIHASKHAILINLVRISQALVKETQVLGFKLGLSIMEIVRSVSKVAMDPSHQTQGDTTVALMRAVRDMRPLLDNTIMAYLKYG